MYSGQFWGPEIRMRSSDPNIVVKIPSEQETTSTVSLVDRLYYFPGFQIDYCLEKWQFQHPNILFCGITDISSGWTPGLWSLHESLDQPDYFTRLKKSNYILLLARFFWKYGLDHMHQCLLKTYVGQRKTQSSIWSWVEPHPLFATQVSGPRHFLASDFVLGELQSYPVVLLTNKNEALTWNRKA